MTGPGHSRDSISLPPLATRDAAKAPPQVNRTGEPADHAAVDPSQRPGQVSVLLVDDHDLIRRGLRQALERNGEFTVIGEAATAADAERLAAVLKPDVVIMDLQLPDGSGLDVTRALRAADSATGIVVLTTYAGDDHLFAAMDAGASAFVPKSAPVGEVIAVARYAASAPLAFTAADLADAMKRRLTPQGPQLSVPEGQVLGLLADGTSVSGIARQLFISESTAKHLVAKLLEKLGATNRMQALMAATRLGLLETSGNTGGDLYR